MGSDLQRSCERRTCHLDVRPKGKLCREHHAEAMHGWRKLRKSAGLPIAGGHLHGFAGVRPGAGRPAPCAACRKRDGVGDGPDRPQHPSDPAGRSPGPLGLPAVPTYPRARSARTMGAEYRLNNAIRY